MIIVPLLIRPVFIRICRKLPDLMVLLNIIFKIPLICIWPSYAGTVLNPSTERDYIDFVFAELGRLTGALFVETEQFEMVKRMSSRLILTLMEKRLDSTSWDRGWESTDVSWQDEEGDLLTNYEKEAILHESGHSVGLEHPNGDGYEPRFTTDITQMSYNPGDRLMSLGIAIWIKKRSERSGSQKRHLHLHPLQHR